MKLWLDIESLDTSNVPWSLLGDFNTIQDLNENSGGRGNWLEDKRIFKSFLVSNGLSDIQSTGPYHTWWNKGRNNLITRKLDRILGNHAWLSSIQHSDAVMLSFFLGAYRIIVQSKILNGLGNDSDQQEETLLTGKLWQLLDQEENIVHQRSGVQWLELGDQNTAYFHKKLIARRFSQILPSLIDKVQGAFVKGRSISDNILVAQEILKGHSNSRNAPSAVFKMDIHKAFDKCHWQPIIDVLILRGQGDPLAPFLFVLIMDVLSEMLQKAKDAPGFKLHRRAKYLDINHLFIADDLLMFCHGDMASIETLMLTLDRFYVLSGLKINLAKSSCFISRFPEGLEE
ncbi:hypothetical protein AgCh_028975 [Apium graveolens]